MTLTGDGNVIFGGDAPGSAGGGVLRDCCCDKGVAFLSLKQAAAGSSLIVAVLDDGDEGIVLWVEEVFPAISSAPTSATYFGMRSHRGVLHVALKPTSPASPSIFLLDEDNGGTLDSRALTLASGGALNRGGITVNNAGDIHVVGMDGAAIELFRLNSSLATVDSVAHDDATTFINPPFYNFAALGRQRVLSSTAFGDPCLGADPYCFRFNVDCTYPGNVLGRWKPGQDDALGPFNQSGAPVFKGGNTYPDVLVGFQDFPGLGPVVGSVTSFDANAATQLILDPGYVGTFAVDETHAWLAGDSAISKRLNNSPGTTVWSKTLGADFLSDITWTTPRLDILRHRNRTLWVLARDIDAGSPKAVLACFTESLAGGLTEKWRMDLKADSDVLWTEPDTLDNWRGWVLNCPGNGFDEAAAFAWS